MLTLATIAAAALAQPVDPFNWSTLVGPETPPQSVWRGFKKYDFPAKGWTHTSGELTSDAGGGGGDIMTREQYGDFELLFEFRCAPKANSGVIYRSTEKHGASWQTGPEFQVLDDAGNNLKPDHPHSAGAMYDILKPPADKVYKTGEAWNAGRIYMRNGLLQHWLNGRKVAEVEAFDAAGKPTEAWTKAIAGSKFKGYEGFGVQPKGSIVLQDHGDSVSYRSVRVRALDQAVPGEVKLFNGKDLTGWTPIVPELAAKNEDQSRPWSVRDGVLVCAGNPVGYLRTNDKYTNFVLRLQWRFDPAKGAGNSGVLLRTNGEDKVWPRSIEAQLHSGNAGDFWNIGEMKMGVAADRTKGRNTRKTHGAERALGLWNEYEIVVDKGNVSLKVNGEELNSATGCEETPGYICLQSEGAYIEYRDIRIVPLP
ncbi:MAG TPA: DUF1080 domain-containing protein [Phycisphaerales bacterium]|nr:DUF1080 domain-containing protein [Phycisphaerales bacterium]